jgi:hypothetical protein
MSVRAFFVKTNIWHANFRTSQNVSTPILGEANILVRQPRLALGLLPTREKELVLPNG